MARRLKFRHRIGILVALAAVGLATVTAVTLVLGQRSEQELSGIETRYVPQIELDRDLKTTFVQLTRSLEDASSAADESRLADADALVRELVQRLHSGREVIVDNGHDPEAVERELGAFYRVAREVSAAVVAGVPPDQLTDKIDAMQRARRTFTTQLDAAAAPDRRGLEAAFAAARSSQRRASQIEIIVAIVALALMALLSWRIIRRTVKSLHDVTAGVERLARGELHDEIDVAAGDELGDLASEANRTAARLRDYRERTQTLMAETRHQSEELERASRLKSEFLANMSHELRTPLNAIIGFTELIHGHQVGPVNAAQEEFLGDVLTSARHLLQLINDVLDLAKVESGKMAFYLEPVEIAPLVGDVRDVLRGLATSTGVKIEVDVHREIVTVVVDPARIKQVLINLLSNAIKFTSHGGTVTVRVGPAEDPTEFRVDVEDTGIGIAEQDLPKLFVDFQQLDTSAEKRYQGTGLGLALSRRFVEGHRGRIEVKSVLGKGSTFSAILPRAASVASDQL